MIFNVGDVADGVLVTAITSTGQQIATAVRRRRKSRVEDDVAVARWFDTYELTSRVLDLPAIPEEIEQRLGDALYSDEIQAAVHDLLAVRLARGTASDAALARDAFCLTLTTVAPGALDIAVVLADYYDDQIRELVARLESAEPALLEEIRNEALPTRIVSALHAIERHVAALSSRPGLRSEAHFIASYQRHIVEEHGRLTPPDFDRRRLVPIDEIYVPNMIVENNLLEQGGVQRELDVWRLAAEIDRSVLLGDPGGGKTTAARVLMHYFAGKGLTGEQRWPIPFLVTVREYAATYPPERSVVKYIEHELETFYQCPAPPGLVDLLLLTGRAVVIFDGLDELLDTSRRQDVAARVERFCAEYPYAAVLVTSRLIGYDQARLDEARFTCYRLAGFREEQVGEYARKWFAQEEESDPDDAETFMSESNSISDIRANPLLLALLCILYRGQGSLPRSRVEVYEQCTNLLFRRWDARRKIHQELRAGRLLEATLRHFANWLLLRDDARSAVTERELVSITSQFLHGRGFESLDEAREAANEFVEFCRGRIWVFTDAGTTGSGEKLYSFTHRTFLEYFAAAYLAYGNDTPERLSAAIADRVARSEWLLVSELALQIKDRTCNDGALRAYKFLLDDASRRPPAEQDGTLRFLALCLRSVDPSPECVRKLTRQVIEHACTADARRLAEVESEHLTGTRAPLQPPCLALPVLLGPGIYQDLVADQIDSTLADKIASESKPPPSGVRVMISLPYALPSWEQGNPAMDFWLSRASNNIGVHRDAVIAAAETDAYIRLIALNNGLITTRTALTMPGGPAVLFQESHGCFECYFPYFTDLFHALDGSQVEPSATYLIDDLAAFGEYLLDHPVPPWIIDRVDYSTEESGKEGRKKRLFAAPDKLTNAEYLGAAALILILAEASQNVSHAPITWLPELIPYQAYRRDKVLHKAITRSTDHRSKLPVPYEFEQTFRRWAELKVGFIESAPVAVSAASAAT